MIRVYRDYPNNGGLRMAKKTKGELSVADPEFCAKWLGKSHVAKRTGKTMKLLAVVGRETGQPAIIYKGTYDKDRHKKVSPETFYERCKKRGFVPIRTADGYYLRLWTSAYAKEKGIKIPAGFKLRKRVKPTFEKLKEKAKAMKLRKWTMKKSKRSLAASIKRALKSPKRKKGKGKGKGKHAEKPKSKGKGKGKGKFGKLLRGKGDEEE